MLWKMFIAATLIVIAVSAALRIVYPSQDPLLIAFVSGVAGGAAVVVASALVRRQRRED